MLAPALLPGQDVVNFMDSDAWTDVVTQSGWLAMLDACTSANIHKNPETEEVAGAEQTEIVKTFSKWLVDRTKSSLEGGADIQSVGIANGAA